MLKMMSSFSNPGKHQHLLLLLLPLLLLPLFVPLRLCHAFDAEAINDDINAVLACRQSTSPAMAVTIVKDGHVLLSRGYGVTKPGGDERVTNQTRFNVASLSKAFAATLLLKVMEEDGRYNLSSKVRDILGDDLQFADEVRTQEATVEDLLSHKMAIPSNNRIRCDTNLTRANLKDRLKYLKSPLGFRNTYIYSNLMYGLATRMAEVVGKARWEDLVRRHLFEPLGMNRSTFVREAMSDASGFARPYTDYFGTLKSVSPYLSRYWSELAGSGSVVTTAADMVKWINFHLSKGQGPEGNRVLTESTVEELYKPRTALLRSPMTLFRQPDVPVTFTYDVYAMGFWRGYYRGYPLIGHSGSTYGYRALLTLVPSQKLGIFTALTGGDPKYRTRASLHSYLMDRVLGQAPWLNTSTLCSFPAPWHNNSADQTAPPYNTSNPLAYKLSAYVGSYSNPAYGTLEVKKWQDSKNRSVDDGREPAALLTLFYGFGTWDLIPIPSSSSSSSSPGKESFFGKGRNVTAWSDISSFVFHAPPAGSDVVMKMSAQGFEKRLVPVFTRGGKSTSGCGVCRGCHFWLVFLFCVAFGSVLI